MIDKEFVPYEQALALKELGFDEPCLGAWAEHGFMTPNDVSSLQDDITIEDIENTQDENMCLAPLYQQAFRWFREKCELYSCINNFTEELGNKKVYFIYEIRNPEQFELSETYNTYEEAELACLIKLIQIVKDDTSQT